MKTDNALILSDNVVVAHQIAGLLGNLNLKTTTVYNRIDAYAALEASATGLSKPVGVLVTDIEDPDLEGTTIAGWYKAITSDISWYAICRPDCRTTPMLVARAQRVDGVFYLNRTGLSLDPKLGLTREILNLRPTPKRTFKLPQQLLPSAATWLDSGLLAGA